MQKDRQNMRHYERNVLYNGRPIDLRLISSVSVLFRTLVRLNSDTFVRLRTLSYRVRLSSIGLFKFRTLPFNFGPFHPIFNFGQFCPLSDASVRFWTVASDFNRFHQFRVFSSGFGCWHCLINSGQFCHFYWDTCGSPVIKCLCFFVFFTGIPVVAQS